MLVNVRLHKGENRAKQWILKNKLWNFRGGFVEHLNRTQAAQRVIEIIDIIVIHLVTHKAAVKHELLFNKTASVS